jgi:hypothetical protein
MDELKLFVELFTVDILLIGAITLMAAALAVKLFLRLAGGTPAPGYLWFVDAIRRALVPWSSGNGKPDWVGIALLVLAAAMVGMVVNLTADEILEKNALVSWLSAGKVKQGEDDIKFKQVDKLMNLNLSPSLAAKVRCQGKTKRQATAFVQHAYASVFYDENASRFASIRTELLFVKLLRVLWLDALLVFSAGILGSLYGARERKQRLRRLLAAACLFAGACVTSSLLLSAWEEQSGRYYLKLTHAYVQTRLADDKLLAQECPPTVQKQ